MFELSWYRVNNYIDYEYVWYMFKPNILLIGYESNSQNYSQLTVGGNLSQQLKGRERDSEAGASRQLRWWTASRLGSRIEWSKDGGG